MLGGGELGGVSPVSLSVINDCIERNPTFVDPTFDVGAAPVLKLSCGVLYIVA